MTEQTLTDIFNCILDGDPLGGLSGLIRMDSGTPLAALNQQLYMPAGTGSVDVLLHEQERMQEQLTSATGHDRAMLTYNLACIVLNQDDVQEAQIYFQDALEISPGFLPALHNLAYTKELMAELGEAELLYREVLRRDPEFALSRLNLALLQWQRGEPEAMETLRDLAAAHPGSPSLVLYLSRMLLSDGSTGGAAEVLDLMSGVAGWEEYPDLRECHAYASFLLNELEAAEDGFRKLIEEDGNNQFARVGMIRILSGRDAWDEVAEHAARLHDIAPSEQTEAVLGILREMGHAAD